MLGLVRNRCAHRRAVAVEIGPERQRDLDQLRCVARAGVGVLLRDGFAFRLVTIEQRGSRPSVLDGGDLPGEVMRVLHTGVETESARRRKTMGGIADEERVPLAITLRD